MMRFQPINFVTTRAPVLRRWGAFALVVVLVADAAYSYLRARDELERAAQLHAMVTRPPSLSAPADVRRANAAMEDAQKLAMRLATPWDGLFNAIERAGGGGVQVQAIRPNSGTQQLVIAAEAKDLPAMLNFLTRLGREPVLVQPYIQNHELKADGSPFPFQFVVAADWRQESTR